MPRTRVRACPAEITLDFLASKWRPMVIFWLLDGPMRFNALQRRLAGVTHRTLSKTLKEMEEELGLDEPSGETEAPSAPPGPDRPGK